VLLHHEGSTISGGCPVGEGYDDVVRVRWNALRRSFVTMPFPEELPESRQPSQLHSSLVFGMADAHDAGQVFSLSSGEVSIRGAEPGGAWQVQVDGGVDAAATERLHALIRRACVDWPIPSEPGARFEFERDTTSHVGRCGGTILGCELVVDRTLRVVPPPDVVIACLRRVPEFGARSELQRSCVAAWPDAGVAELMLALTLREEGQPEVSLPHLELALAKGGLSAKDRALALELLRDH
jgi:hypothetical protein